MDLNYHLAITHQQGLLAAAARRATRRPSFAWLRSLLPTAERGVTAPQATPCPTC